MYFAMYFGDVLTNEQRLVVAGVFVDRVSDVVFSLCAGTVDGGGRVARIRGRMRRKRQSDELSERQRRQE